MVSYHTSASTPKSLVCITSRKQRQYLAASIAKDCSALRYYTQSEMSLLQLAELHDKKRPENLRAHLSCMERTIMHVLKDTERHSSGSSSSSSINSRNNTRTTSRGRTPPPNAIMGRGVSLCSRRTLASLAQRNPPARHGRMGQLDDHVRLLSRFADA